MNALELKAEESDVLHQVLEHSLATLELEIRHTDHNEFKTFLKKRRDLLQALIAKLDQPAVAIA